MKFNIDIDTIGSIEKYGSGIKRAVDGIIPYGLPKPEIKKIAGGIEVEIFSDTKDLEKDLENISENQNSIIKAIAQNNNITQKELSKKIGINEKNIRNNIEKFKSQGLLRRIGPDKGGKWEISMK